MMQNSKQSNRKLRKLGVGAASMMIGLTMLGVASANNEAHADAGQSTIPVAAKPTATATTNNSTATNTSSNTATNSNANVQQTVNRSIKAVPAGTNANGNSSLTSEQQRLSAETPTIANNASYDATATNPSVTDEQVSHGVYVSTADSSERTAFSITNNTTLSEQAVINPSKTDALTAHGVVTNNSNQTKHIHVVYQLPYAYESESEVNNFVTLDSSRFDPSKGITVNGGSNVQVSYTDGRKNAAGETIYDTIDQLPADFDLSKVTYFIVDVDLAAGQSMNVEIPLKIDTSKINQSLIYGANNYWANRFHVGEQGFYINNNYSVNYPTDLQMRFGAPSYDVSAHAGEYFLLTYRDSKSGKYYTLPIETYQMFKNSDDADTMKISSSNVHFMNYHPADVNNAQSYAQAIATNNDGEHIMWTGSVYFIDLPAMQKVLTKYGYSFNLKNNNSSVMDYYTYNNYGGKTSVGSTLKIFNEGKKNGMKISPALYIEVHHLLEGKDVTVQHGGSWNFMDNVALAKNLNGAKEVAANASDLSYDGNVDVNKDGDYVITLQLKLADGETVTAPATVHVVPVKTQTKTTKNVTRTIVFHEPNGTTNSQVQSVPFVHTINLVNGKQSSDSWDVASQNIAAYAIPAITGYHATINNQVVTEVPAATVNHDSDNLTVDVYYAPDYTTATESHDVTRTINLHQVDGSVVPTVQTVHFNRTNTTNTITGDVTHGAWAADGSDGFGAYSIPAVAGYHATIDGQTVTVVPAVNGVTADTADSTVDVYYAANPVTTNESHDVIRTINLHQVDGTIVPTVQRVHFIRTNTTTAGHTTYGDWHVDGSDSFDVYTIPAVAGYHATLNGQVVSVVPAVNNVAENTANSTVDVYYAPDYTTATESRNVTRTINLHQLDGSVVPTVQTVRFTRTNRTNTITGEVTDGTWAADGNDNFAEYVIPAVAGYHATVDGQTVTVVPAVATVNADAANSTVDVFYAANVSTATEDHNVTRTINLHRPDGTVDPTVQTVHFTRTNTTTAGHTTYGDWHADGNDEFVEYQIPTLAGYHATLNGQVVTAVPAAENVAENAANTTVDIYYVSNYTTATEGHDVTRTINLHQLDGSVDPTVQTVHFTRTNTTNVLTGQVMHSAWTADGDDSFAAYEIPAIDGYHAEVNGDTTTVVRAVNNVAATAANSVVDIYYVANNNRPSDTTTTTETRAVTRTINLHEPGGVVPHTQAIHFNRTNTTTDGQTTYGAWTADGSNSFAAYNVPAIAGYHATLNGQTITVVPAVSDVTADTASSTVDVYYVADAAQPTQPTTPVQPSQPTAPVNPSQPTTPVNPSTTPNRPSDNHNTQPNQSTTPTTPVQPSRPTAPVNPSQPTTPVNPSTTPNRPSDNHNSQPNVPTTPNKPSAQGEITTNNGTPAANQTNATANATTVATPTVKAQASAQSNAQQASSNKQQTLPQTGNDKTGILGLAGLALAGLGMMLGSDKRRKD